MIVTVNGEDRSVPDGCSVLELVESLGVSPGGRGVAVAVSGAVVPRSEWETTALRAGALVEVLIAVQGG